MKVVNMGKQVPIGLKIVDFKDFCMRCDEIYALFWDDFAPFFDIAKYRAYLLKKVKFSNKQNKQETIAGITWEYLMGDIDKEDLFDFYKGRK